MLRLQMMDLMKFFVVVLYLGELQQQNANAKKNKKIVRIWMKAICQIENGMETI